MSFVIGRGLAIGVAFLDAVEANPQWDRRYGPPRTPPTRPDPLHEYGIRARWNSDIVADVWNQPPPSRLPFAHNYPREPISVPGVYSFKPNLSIGHQPAENHYILDADERAKVDGHYHNRASSPGPVVQPKPYLSRSQITSMLCSTVRAECHELCDLKDFGHQRHLKIKCKNVCEAHNRRCNGEKCDQKEGAGKVWKPVATFCSQTCGVDPEPVCVDPPSAYGYDGYKYSGRCECTTGKPIWSEETYECVDQWTCDDQLGLHEVEEVYVEPEPEYTEPEYEEEPEPEYEEEPVYEEPDYVPFDTSARVLPEAARREPASSMILGTQYLAAPGGQAAPAQNATGDVS